jgi:RNA polymerase sigma-70 factor (ECF subfamily)
MVWRRQWTDRRGSRSVVCPDLSRLRLRRQPEEHRQVIELRFQAELSLEEISGALGIPLGTVKSRLHHGLEKLRQQKFCVNLFSTTVESRARQA